MMKCKLSLVALFIANMGFAQIELPQVSTPAEVEQTIGYTKIEVDYSRPNLKNRKAFGGELVPYNKLWRTGANNNATVDISTDVTIEGKQLTKGKYAMFVLPTEKEWEIIFYKKTDNWGVPEKLDEALVALRVKTPVLSTKDHYETFTIGFNNTGIEQTQMFMAWDHTKAQITIAANTIEAAEAVIKEKLNEQSSARDYFSVAYYYYSNDLNLEKALELINIAMKKDPEAAFYQRYKDRIEKALEKKK